MGGRQAHGRPVLPGAGAGKKKNKQRSNSGKSSDPRHTKTSRVDVLALAEKQLGEQKTKGVRRRDLDVERDEDEAAGGERRGRSGEEGATGATGGDSDEEIHSDSSGNEWHVGVGSDDDDSEIDSDEAFGESDEEMFDGYTFGGSSSAKSKKAKKRKEDFEGFDEDEDEDEEGDEDVGEDGESLGEDAIDLAEALDQVSSDEEGPSKEAKKKPTATSDSEEESEESVSGSESESESESESDSDIDLDDGDNLDALTSIASAFAGKGNADAQPAADALSKVSLADLGLTNIRDPQIKKAVKMLEKEEKGEAAPGKSKKLDVPLERMQQEELLRVAAAEKASETLGRWVDTVKQNRRAEHLSFPVAGALAESGLDTTELQPITPKTAHTELEKTILSIMEESGLGPRADKEKPDKAKEEKALSPEELQQLVSQRRRERELQSRETARAKRIKKIKSKAYRRVHRREKARNEAALAELEEGEEVDSEEEREAMHRQRAMERMGSRHRESKWAKRAKHTGRAAWDDDFRSGLVDMARRDEELRRRVEGKADGNGSDDDDDESHEGEDEEAFRQRITQELQQAGEAGEEEPHSALLNIAFMKKAELARKRANDDAVAEILRDLKQGSEDEDEEDTKDKEEWTVVGRRTYGMAGGRPTQAEMSRAAGLKKGGEKKKEKETESTAAESRDKESWGASLFREDVPDAVHGGAGSWAKTARASKNKKQKAVRAAEVNLQVDQVVAQLSKKPAAANADDDDTSSSGSSDDEDEDRQDSWRGGCQRAVGRLQTDDANLLVQALGDDDAEAEFAREKERLAAEEAEAEEARSTKKGRQDSEVLPGWGSWAGEGLRKRPARTDDKADERGRKKAKKEPARRDAKLERVIISERQVRKTSKYLASQLPHEFETRNQYERSLRLPVGPEWGTKMAFQEATKPRVLLKQGVVLPMARPAV